MAEKSDELEEIIGVEKKKLEKEVGTKKPAPQTTEQMQEGFSGMQQSIMEEPTGAEMPSQIPEIPQQQIFTPFQQEQQPEKETLPEPEIPQEEMATIPSLPIAQLAYNRTNIEEIESLIESVVEEKWRQAMDSFQNFNIWREKARVEIISIKQELIRLTQRFENMEKAMIGRVHEYDTHVLDIGAEIKAIEKVMQKIVQPLSQNIKELESLTKRLKK